MEKFLKPKEGLIVRDPKTKVPLPADGMLKTFIGPEGRYWRRRVNDGSVTVIDQKRYAVHNIRRKKADDAEEK